MDPLMILRIAGAPLCEALAILAVLREHVSLEVIRGSSKEQFLFVRQGFLGNAAQLAKLRFLLAEKGPVEVVITASTRLADLFGKPITATELLIDPEGTMGE